MKIKYNLFSKSFLLSFVAFGLLAAIIITSIYLNVNAIDPQNEESTVLIGITNKDELLSLCLINIDPSANKLTFLPLPDNIWIENGTVLQNLYEKRGISSLENAIEKLISAKINRYMLFSIESISSINNELGPFTLNAPYPFEYNGSVKAGALQMDGELAKAMLSYQGYDMTKVSFSNIAYSYLTTFLSTFAKPSHIEGLTDVLSSKAFIRSTHTNFSRKEIKAYCEILSQYSLFSQATISMKGTYNPASSSIYFIPDISQSNKNIFK